jgi:hypothetical protein
MQRQERDGGREEQVEDRYVRRWSRWQEEEVMLEMTEIEDRNMLAI